MTTQTDSATTTGSTESNSSNDNHDADHQIVSLNNTIIGKVDDRIVIDVDDDNNEWIIEKKLVNITSLNNNHNDNSKNNNATTAATTTTTANDQSSTTNAKINDIELTYTQSMEVDTTFERLFGYKWGTRFLLSSSSRNNTNSDNDDNNNNNMTTASDDLNEPSLSELGHENDDTTAEPPEVLSLLCKMLGRNTAAKIIYQQMQKSSLGNNNRRHKLRYKLSNNQSIHFTNTNKNTIRATKMPPYYYANQHNNEHNTNSSILSNPTNTTTKTTTVVPAMQSLSTSMTRTSDVDTGIKGSSSSVSVKAAAVGVDVLLQKISDEDKGKLSTIAKSSNDWDIFKNEHKELGSQLEQHTTSQQSFLGKQEFLSRIDQRQFEIEKSIRTIERSKRGI
jgi:Bucentaur or craniofacial development